MAASEYEKSFIDKSLWEKCQTITHDLSWHNRPDSTLNNVRQATWAHSPYRYMLSEYGHTESALFRRQKIIPKLFEVACLGATKADVELRDYRRYFITHDSPEVFLIQSEVDTPANEQESGAIAADFEFKLENGLYIPNSEDILVLDHALSLAYYDGIEPVMSA